MATTSNTYTGNGSNKLFSITFPYLETSDIDVYLNGTLQTITTQYFFANATTVEFVAAPGAGVTVLLKRSTDEVTISNIFFPGSSIKAADLNDNFDQVLFLAQETNNNVANAVAGQIPDGTITSAKIADGAIVNADVNASAGIVATKLAFTQVGTGATTRTVDSKLKELELNVKDFGAVGDGVTYDSPAIALALAEAQKIVNNGAGFGSQIGIKLKFPRGKYRISEPIPLLYGITIVGEQSGLTNAGNSLSTGTILLLSNTLPGGATWTTSTLVGGNTIAKRVMFTIVDGGPIQMENFGAIPEANNSTNAVFLLAGNGFPVPHNSVGVTQALFRGIRAFEFGEVFRGSRFADVTIENCGFEYNTTVFSPVASGFVAFGGINSTNTQYFENYSLVDLVTGASFNDTNFSSCIFATEGSTNSNLVWGYGGDFSNVHFSSCEFSRGAANTGNAISVLGTTFLCQGVTFASCRIKDLPLFNQTQIATANDQLLNNSFAGNTFENCPVTVEYEGRGGNSFVGNAFTGTSSFSHKGDGLVFAANNFNENSFSGNDFTLVDTSNATIVGNVFRSAKQSINFATLSTCKITDNVNQSSWATLSKTTVTGGSSGWSNSTPTPEFYYDETGHVRCRGVVTNSGSPGASSIMCQGLPAPTGDKWFVLPATDNTAGSAVVTIGSGGSELYFLARNGTSNSYDLSPISYSTL